jgi:hypothetical protein
MDRLRVHGGLPWRSSVGVECRRLHWRSPGAAGRFVGRRAGVVAVGRARLERPARQGTPQRRVPSGQDVNYLIFLLFPFSGFQGAKPLGRFFGRVVHGRENRSSNAARRASLPRTAGLAHSAARPVSALALRLAEAYPAYFGGLKRAPARRPLVLATRAEVATHLSSTPSCRALSADADPAGGRFGDRRAGDARQTPRDPHRCHRATIRPSTFRTSGNCVLNSSTSKSRSSRPVSRQ